MKSLSLPPCCLLNLNLHLSFALPSTPQGCSNALPKDTSTQAHNPGDRTTHVQPHRNTTQLCPTNRLGQSRTLSNMTTKSVKRHLSWTHSPRWLRSHKPNTTTKPPKHNGKGRITLHTEPDPCQEGKLTIIYNDKTRRRAAKNQNLHPPKQRRHHPTRTHNRSPRRPHSEEVNTAHRSHTHSHNPTACTQPRRRNENQPPPRAFLYIA